MVFFKKKITEQMAAGIVVVSVFKYLDDGSLRTELENYNENIGKPLNVEIQDLDQAETDYRIAQLAVETQALPNLFPRDQSERLRAHTAAVLNEMSPSGFLVREVNRYESAWRSAINANLNPIITAVEILLFRWAGFANPTIPATVSSSPLASTYVSSMLLSGMGRWKRVKDAYRLK